MSATGFNIVSLFHEAAQKFPDRLAIAGKDGEITFGEMRKRILSCAAHQRKKGLNPGDRVLVFVPMSIDLYVHVLALYHNGCTAVFLDEWVSVKRLKLCCEIAKCRGFIGIPFARFVGFFVGAIRSIPVHLSSDTKSFEKAEITDALRIDKNSETALITFTTGSTGVPKAAKRTHDFLKVQFDALMEKIQPSDDDIDMPVLPIVLMINLGCGIPSVIANWKSGKPEKMKPEIIWQQMIDYKVNRITSSPYFLNKMSGFILDYQKGTGHIRKIFTGGAPVFPAHAGLVNMAFPNARFEIVYGSTEAEPISSVNGKELSQQLNVLGAKGLLVGKPYHGSRVKIIQWKDESISSSSLSELESLELNEGEIGEIIVSGAHVLREYFNNPEALKRNKIMWENECWHRTGDSGFLKHGILYLTGRANTLFYKDGKLVAPFLYEYAFSLIQGVEIGTIMDIHQKIVFVIELKYGADRQEVETKLNAMWPAPDKIYFMLKVPRDKRHHSKIEYGMIRQRLMS